MCISLIIFLLTFYVAPLFGQEEEEESIPPPRRARAAKVGGGGGFTPVLLFWNVDALNDFVPLNASKFDNTPMLLLGGGGYAYIMLIENLRVGGMGAGGSTTTSAVSGGVRRDLEVSIGFGGVTIEYTIPVFERLDIVPGILLGGGGFDITMTRDRGGLKTWDSLWTEFDTNSPTSDLSRKLEGTFFVYQPSLQVEFAVLRWLGLRVGVSYVGMASPSWELDERFDVAGVPENIKGQGWIIHTGLFVGTFLF